MHSQSLALPLSGTYTADPVHSSFGFAVRYVLESELPVGMANGAFAEDDTLADAEMTVRLGDLLDDLLRELEAPLERRHDGSRARAPAVRPGSDPRERADAARNRERILAAAAELVGERGIERVSMDDVAQAAGVGTGTLYRRFGDRAGLALALLDEDTREFQDALIGGPPPLGPGAPAAERLRAFGDGYLDLLERHAEVLVVAVRAAGEARGPHAFYATHLAILLREAAPQLDAEFTAQALLAMLSPSHHLRSRRGFEWPLERLRAGWRGVVDALSGGA